MSVDLLNQIHPYNSMQPDADLEIMCLTHFDRIRIAVFDPQQMFNRCERLTAIPF